MARKSKNRRERDPEDLLNWLVAGEGGSGKTTALAYFAQLGKVIHCDSEGSLRLRPLRNLGVAVDNIERRRIRRFKDLVDVYDEARDALLSDPWSIHAINIDTTNEAYQNFMDEVLVEKRKRQGGVGMVYEEREGRDEHQIITRKFRRLARRFRDLPCHVGWTAHLKRDTDDDGEVAYRADLTPAFGKSLNGFVDLTTTHREFAGGFVALSQPMGKYRAAKDRIGFMPPVLANPTADRVVDLLLGNLDLSKDGDQREYLKAVRKRGKK